MKTITAPKNLPSYITKVIDNATEQAYGFITSRYGWQFDNVNLQFTMSGRSKYKSNQKFRELIPNVKIGVAKIGCNRAKLYLYDRKTVGLQYKQGVTIGYMINIATAIVHELTHHVQYCEGRKYSEVETTMNELDFIKLNYPELFDRIVINNAV